MISTAKKHFTFSVIFFTWLLFLFVACKEYKRNSLYAKVPLSSIRKGETLSKQYCQSCHQWPEPSLLDATTWEEGVLPNMGPRLGIFEFQQIRYPHGKNDTLLDKNFYPSRPVLTPEEWNSILDFYTATSPDSLARPHRQLTIQKSLPLFQVHLPQHLVAEPAVSYIKIDTLSQKNRLLLYDLRAQNILCLDSELKLQDSLPLAGAVVDMELQQNKMLVCNVGDINPNNGKFGKASLIQTDANKRMKGDSTLLNQLARPVQNTTADMDGDGLQDQLVCEFGFMAGSLSWYRNLGNHQYSRHIIKNIPGAIKAYVLDYNKDGLPDIWVLFAQGDEGIHLFTSKGNGRFEEKRILNFPPVYGSTFFELADFNQDGFLDIVYTCGDNADYSTVLKPYHGVYVFLNDGKGAFRQQFFYPINGCYKALARDFDGDGDLDIATISFFADYARQPEEGFVYFENLGKFNFRLYTFTESLSGRWLTMDAGDLDGDGRTDLVLGNFAVGPANIKPANDWRKGPWFIYLRNIGKHRKD